MHKARWLAPPYLLLMLAFAPAALGQEEDPAPQPPRLKRGIPKAGDKRGEEAPEQKPINLPPAVREIVTDADGNIVSEKGAPSVTVQNPANPVDDPIQRARERVVEFGEGMPNFICDQITFRYEGEGWPKPTWKLKDRITAELMHNDGRESYRNVKVSGKLLGLGRNKPPEKTGQWSTGDWVTITIDVLNPSTDARFTADGEEAIGGRPARRYRYRVQQPNSHWRVEAEGYPLKPAYKGRIWIDKDTNQALRVEMEAVELPKDYPFNIVEMTTELATMPIAGTAYLLPVKAENLTCQRDTVTCHRNELQFRAYRKFSAESTISTTDSSVTFEGEPGEPKPAPAPSGTPAADGPPTMKRGKKK